MFSSDTCLMLDPFWLPPLPHVCRSTIDCCTMPRESKEGKSQTGSRSPRPSVGQSMAFATLSPARPRRPSGRKHCCDDSHTTWMASVSADERLSVSLPPSPLSTLVPPSLSGTDRNGANEERIILDPRRRAHLQRMPPPPRHH